ncbi:MAG: hypothetical protein WD830_08640, partial [Chloroflexota bacterium]
GKTEQAALEAFVEYGPRYATVVERVSTGLTLPKAVGDLEIGLRLKGGPGTEFGVPSAIADFDLAPVTARQLERLVELLRAAWAAFSRAAYMASGKPLSTGPRGGGRALDKIRDHVREADEAYIAGLGARAPRGADWQQVQDAFVDALGAKVRGELPDRGPRGGERWPARYAIRRSAWHALDHAWEIDDRAKS